MNHLFAPTLPKFSFVYYIHPSFFFFLLFFYHSSFLSILLVITFGQVHGAVLVGFLLSRDGLDRRLTSHVSSVSVCLALSCLCDSHLIDAVVFCGLIASSCKVLGRCKRVVYECVCVSSILFLDPRNSPRLLVLEAALDFCYVGLRITWSRLGWMRIGHECKRKQCIIQIQPAVQFNSEFQYFFFL